jgi:hypothetical protein
VQSFPCQVPWDSRPYLTVSNLRLPFSSPPTTRRVTMKVFDPASTRVPPPILLSLSLSLMLRPTVSRPVCLGIKHPSRAYDQIFFSRSEYGIRLTVTFLIPWVTLSDERLGLSFVCAAGPCQRSLSRVLVPWDLRPYFTVSDLRLPFLSPPTTRRVAVEVFDPASTWVRSTEHGRSSHIASERTFRKHRLYHLFYYCVTSQCTRKLRTLHRNAFVYRVTS